MPISPSSRKLITIMLVNKSCFLMLRLFGTVFSIGFALISSSPPGQSISHLHRSAEWRSCEARPSMTRQSTYVSSTAPTRMPQKPDNLVNQPLVPVRNSESTSNLRWKRYPPAPSRALLLYRKDFRHADSPDRCEGGCD